MKVNMPRSRNRTIRSSGTMRMEVASLLTKLPSSKGLSRAGKAGSDAATTAMLATATKNTRQ